VKENVLDVLMYLFEHYYIDGDMDDGTDADFPPDQETLTSELAEAGFARGEITKAFSWLEALTQVRAGSVELVSAGRGGVRHFSPVELKKLDAICRGFLQQMESAGVLDVAARELVIERVMALEVEEITLEQLKWVMWMVLFHHPGQEAAHAILEDLVFDEREGHLH
jgi:Smg protein